MSSAARRLAALGVVAAAAALVGAAVGAGDGSSGASTKPAPTKTSAGRQAAPPKPTELPLGGRRIFPRYRVVAYYGAPQAEALGALGIGCPEGRARLASRPPYADTSRP